MKVNKRGQITIPKHLREKTGLHPDVEVEVLQDYGGVMIRQVRKRRWPDGDRAPTSEHRKSRKSREDS